MAIKGVHTADLHFGVTTFSKETPDGLGSRVHDFFKTFDQILEFIKTNDINLLLITGDVFKDREPNSTLRDMFYKRIIDISRSGVTVVIVPGNHDMHPFEYKHHSVKVFEIFDQENIHVMDRLFEQKVFDINGELLRIISVPYPYYERFIKDVSNIDPDNVEISFQNAFEKRLTEILDCINDDIPTILAGHLSVNEAEVGSERGIMLGKDIKVPLSSLINPKLKYVALGHIHKPQILNQKNPTVTYCGSPDRIDFSEANDQKGFIYFEIADDFKFWYQTLRVRPFYQIKINVDNQKNMEDEVIIKLGKKIEDIEKSYPETFKVSIVKLVIYMSSLSKGKLNLNFIEKFLNERCFMVGAIEVEVTDDKRDFRITDIDEKSDPVEAFKKFLYAHQKYKDLQSKDDVVNTFRSIYDMINHTLT